MKNYNKKSLWYLTLIPIYILVFFIIEKIVPSNSDYFISYLPLDDQIPFVPFMVIFYVIWYVYLIGIILYFFFNDDIVFRKTMNFLICSYVISFTVYLLFPNGQNLRPVVSTLGSDIFSSIIKLLYSLDTNTNVLPSMHVLGTLAALFGVLSSSKTKNTFFRILYVIVGILIIASTNMIKQHSILDGIASVLISIPLYFLTFSNKLYLRVRKKEKR